MWIELIGRPRIINSAYRNPARNRSVGGAPGSKHLEGIAVDLRNETRTLEEWQMMYTLAKKAQAQWIEPLAGPCSIGCVHADWRNLPSR
jgi:hypothetical protein